MNLCTALFIFALLVASLCASADSISEKATNDDIVAVRKDDPAMLKAFAMAQRTLPEFLAHAANPAPGTSSYSLKVRISRGGNVEYFWVLPFTHTGTQYSGKLANDGELLPEYRAGQNYEFPESDIVDWLYSDGTKGKMHGNFTACALLTHEDPTEAEAFKQENGLECPDS